MTAEGLRAGTYCEATQRAVEVLQDTRGLPATGICDQATWLAVVEASWRLGDRLLVLSAPHLRGDDVAELQSVLGRLGFDCGRVDGIHGPFTARATAEFQRNCGLPADGVCGPDTVRALQVFARQSGTGPGVAALREIESLATVDRVLADLRLVIGQFGGLSALVRQLTHGLRQRGTVIAPTDEPDASAHAALANRFAATVYLGFRTTSDRSSTITYYSVPGFESVGGRSLAERIHEAFVVSGIPIDVEVVGARLPVLRETRMPAVLCTLGPVETVVDHVPMLAAAVIDALATWTATPLTDSNRDDHRSR